MLNEVLRRERLHINWRIRDWGHKIEATFQPLVTIMLQEASFLLPLKASRFQQRRIKLSDYEGRERGRPPLLPRRVSITLKEKCQDGTFKEIRI